MNFMSFIADSFVSEWWRTWQPALSQFLLYAFIYLFFQVVDVVLSKYYTYTPVERFL
ncbi:MAG TPA: hypothetical protein VFN51_00760 [Candidatus Saccharimonadales bacterium]|nr:hypothetical protein [Candidatus Saccharimonadales bacterium]